MNHSLKDFVPLIGVLAVVVVLTALASEPSIFSVMQMFMGFFFLIFGGFKAVKLSGFVSAYRSYDIVAKRSKMYAYMYPFIEIFLGILFVSGMYLLEASIIAVVIMIIGSIGVLQKLLQKEEIPCACLGDVFKIPMTWVTFGEDILMTLMGVMLLISILG